ncbi:MAG: glycosyltransferase [Actinobacteria bacterium]|nr:MAG: glycosyltransferase [Actinomycetota bacterium]TML75851.1 MAG: glycosyltransferase [Actinomycetota bacterium]
MPPRVSILMPVHNRAHLLDLVLEKLAENTTYPDVELLAVDDHSTDGSPDILRRWEPGGRGPRLRLIESPGRGAIDALNTALHTASGELCVQLDDDVTIETRGWIEKMIELMEVDEAVGVVTGKVVFDAGDIHACGVNVVGPAGWHERGTAPAEPIGHRMRISRVEPRPLEGQAGELETQVAEVDSGIGCCMMYRRADALAAGGYDPEWAPVWFDDVDLCLGIRRLGRKAFYLPDVRAVHHFQARRTDDLSKTHPRRMARGLVRRVGRRLPYPVRNAIEEHVDFDLFGQYTRDECARLRHHHAYWRAKWGWDARNPDMSEVQRRWGGTEICWATDPDRRAAGERIVAEYAGRRGQRSLRTA